MATSPLVLNFIIRGAFSENAKYYCRLGVRDGMSAVYAVHRTLHVECVETLRELALALDLTVCDLLCVSSTRSLAWF